MFDLRTEDAIPAQQLYGPCVEPRKFELVSLGSAPTRQIVRGLTLVGTNLSATVAQQVMLSLGDFTIPFWLPATASPIQFLIQPIHAGNAPISVWDFSLAGPPPAGLTGSLFLLLLEY